MWFLLKGATVLIMIQILVLLENVNVKVRSGLTMTALKQGKKFIFFPRHPVVFEKSFIIHILGNATGMEAMKV